MANHEGPKHPAQPEEKKAILTMCIVWILNQESPVVVEDGLRFLERYPMPPPVFGILLLVPLEAKIRHV